MTEEEEEAEEQKTFSSPIEQREYQLEKAIDIEDYEKAVQIRDEIKRVKSEQKTRQRCRYLPGRASESRPARTRLILPSLRRQNS